MNRRDFLKWMGAGTGAAMAGCARRDPEKVVSYFVPPESWVPGRPTHAVSSCSECPAQCGIVVKAYDKFEGGKTRWMPVKFEGAPGHPVNDGRLCMRGQASITRFYLPDRLKSPLLRERGAERPISWDDAFQRISSALEASAAERRAIVWLAGRTTGTLSGLLDAAAAKLRIERHPEYEPAAAWEAREANRIVFGVADLPTYAVEKAGFLLTIGADVLETFGSPVHFAAGLRHAMDPRPREAVERAGSRFRWWHVEPHFSLTGANADERVVVRPGGEAHLLAWLIRRLLPGEAFGQVPEVSDDELAARVTLPAGQVEGLAETDRKRLVLRKLGELVEGLRGENAMVVAGGVSTQSPGGLTAATLAALLQRGLRMAEKGLLDFRRSQNFPSLAGPAEMKKLADRLKGGEVGVLFVSRANPVANLPAAAGFREALAGARLRVALADFPDETAKECDLVLPLSSPLESWGDAEPRRGTWTLIEPVLYDSTLVQEGKGWKAKGREHRVASPLHDTRSEGDILLDLLRRVAHEKVAASYRDHLLAEWTRRGIKADLFAAGFAVRDPESPKIGETDWAVVREQLRTEAFRRKVEGLVLLQAPTVRAADPRAARLPLLSEIPDPLTTITWGGWVSVPPELAKKEGIGDGDEVRIESSAWTGTMPAKIQQGLPDGILVVARGILAGVPALVENVAVRKTGRKLEIPILSGSESQQGRGIIPMDARPHGGHAKKAEDEDNGLYPAHKHHPYRWAMAIDLEACTGCGACVAACTVENNVPIVGAEDHLRGREMSWLRIEPFYEKRGVEFIPMLCQHCDNGPCEPVCPVFAAYHTPDGLNGQVYNRCVGTRYCSNNCPYKVRRFNWWENGTPERQPLGKMHNPELTVRPRGVMEKCTFCVQRIRDVRDRAKDEGRLVKDGEAERLTACAQTCPTRAIVFGNILDEESLVYKLSRHERGYKVFEELNARPAVTYLHPVEPTS
ncbi:MAG: 4Fe-4S dicluster domain-containing protein [Planctomycetes bacterium]|nr:4Fe-4S dicluster domain-containing protein [Planctomycetota bacterium]